MNKKIKIIAVSALFSFALTAVPGICMAKDSVRKWGYWEDMVTPAAGPQVATLITPTIQDSSPNHDPDPIPVPPVPPVPPPEEAPGLFGYTYVNSYSGEEIGGSGVATMEPYFDENGDPDGTAYDYAYYQEEYGFNPTGTGGFSYSPFGMTAEENGIDGYDSGNLPTDFAFNEDEGPSEFTLRSWGYTRLGESYYYPEGETGFQRWRELTDADGNPTGIYELYWWSYGEGEQVSYYDSWGQGYYGTLTPQSFLDGLAKDLPVLGGSERVGDTGTIDYRGRVQGVYTGYTQRGMDVTVGIDFNAATFAATFGADYDAGFAATGTLTGQHLVSTSLSGINQTGVITGEVRASLIGATAQSMVGAIDVEKHVGEGRDMYVEPQVEAFAASVNGVSMDRAYK